MNRAETACADDRSGCVILGGHLMGDARCTADRHLGEDDEGRCTNCGERIDRPSLLLTMLAFVAVVMAVVLAVWALLNW